MLLIYHAGFFAYYAWDNWKEWCFAVLPGTEKDPDSFPEIQMFLGEGHPPRHVVLLGRLRDGPKGLSTEGVICSYNDDGDTAVWLANWVDDRDGTTSKPLILWSMPVATVRAARRRIRMFRWIDCGFPAVLAASALTIALLQFIR